MSEIVKGLIEDAKDNMNKAVDHVELELQKIRAGKASPQMLDGIVVDYYGTPTPLSQVANVNTPDARTIVVQPWEKSLISAIEKAITDANLGINPQNDGIVVRLNVPPLTEERRKELAKKAKHEAEEAKIGIRSARKDAMESAKKLTKDGITEDEVKGAEEKIQQLTDSFVAKCEKHLELKEKEIMTV